MRHLGLEVHRLEKLMARQRGYSAAHQDADRQTGMHGYLLRYLYENQERDVFQRSDVTIGIIMVVELFFIIKINRERVRIARTNHVSASALNW